MTAKPNNVRLLYRTIVWILLLCSIWVLVKVSPMLYQPELLPSDDFVPFWTGGRLNLNGENPYDPNNVERLQVAAGGQPSGDYTISIMLNPPWAVTMVMPFGIFNYQISRLVWLLFSVVIILISSQLLWLIYSGSARYRWIAILVVFCFAPSITVLEVGQITPLVLLGLSGFLYFEIKHRNDWLAGIFLVLASIKPQAAYIFWIVLLFWVIYQRRWRILLGGLLGISILTSCTVIFNPQVITQYISSLRSYQITDWANPTIGAYLRYFIFGISKYWLQFIPPLLGLIWIIYHWYRNYRTWDWVSELPIILLISQITAPYIWTYDLVILFPVIIQAAVFMITDWKRWSAAFLAITYLAINILDLILHRNLSDFWFIWLAPSFLIWFLLARRHYASTKTNAIIVE